MSSLEAKKIAPATGTTVTLGAAGDTVDVSANALKTNTIKDAGGNTIFTSDGLHSSGKKCLHDITCS